MPIIEIEIVLKPNEILRDKMASEFADRLGEIFGSPKGGTWVKLYSLPESQYAENGGKEEGAYPVFVSVLKSKLPTHEDMQFEVERIASAVAQICERPPTLVHVIYEPEGSGRVAFGGKLIP